MARRKWSPGFDLIAHWIDTYVYPAADRIVNDDFKSMKKHVNAPDNFSATF